MVKVTLNHASRPLCLPDGVLSQACTPTGPSQDTLFPLHMGPSPGGGQDPVPVPCISCLPPACRSQPLGHITHSPFFLCSLAMRSSSWRGPSGRARRRNRRGWRGCGGRSRRTWNWPSRSARLTCLPPRRGLCAGGTGHGQVPERGQCRCLYIHTHTPSPPHSKDRDSGARSG